MTTNPISQHRTFKLDQITTTKLDWSILFLKELGVSSPAQRVILTRAMDLYVEFLEELAVTHSCNPKAKDLRDEAYAVMMLNKERQSAWSSIELPKLDLESFSVFPKYSTLSKQYHNPLKTRLPRVKKPKATGLSFAEIKAKHNQPTQL
jgi:hypothetical protein